MTDEENIKINFLEFAKRYYTYQNKNDKQTDSELNFIMSDLADLGYNSQNYIVLIKKFNHCLSFFGITDTDIFKEGKEYAIFEKDVGFFCSVVYQYSKPASYLKQARTRDIKSSLEEEKLLCDIEQLMRIVKIYASNDNQYAKIINSIINATEYYYLCCVTDIRYIDGMVKDIIDSTVYSSKETAINFYRFLSRDDRITSFKELRTILEDFMHKMETLNNVRENEIMEQFKRYIGERNEDLTEFLDLYNEYRQARNLGSYAYDLTGDDNCNQNFLVHFFDFCKLRGQDVKKIEKQYLVYVELKKAFKPE